MSRPAKKYKAARAASGLAKDSVGLTTVLMQSVAQIAPAVGILTTISFNTQYAGLGAPSTYLLAFLISLIVVTSLSQLAKFFPSAGGFYTYVSATVGPTSGFLTGWLYTLQTAAIPGALASWTAFALEGELKHQYNITAPWQLVVAVILLFVAYIGYRGIGVSGKMLMLFSVTEMVIILVLAVCGVAAPGPGGLSFDGLSPLSSPDLHGFFLAMVFSIFAFTGWEGAAAIAEEARNPRKTIPRAIFGSILLLGAFYVFSAWGIQIGWGTQHLNDLARSATNPAIVLAHRVWGPGWVLVLLALLNSGIAVCIGCTVDSTRNWYAMARAEALPSWMAYVHPKYRTPSHAVFAQAALALLVGLGAGSLVGPDNIFYVLGMTGTLVYVVIYSFGNLGVVRFFGIVRKREFNLILHALFPILATVALFAVAYYSLVPLPAPPVSYAPMVFAVALGLGIALVAKLHISGTEDWKTLSRSTVDYDRTVEGTVAVDDAAACRTVRPS
jgi:amino acid transporter